MSIRKGTTIIAGNSSPLDWTGTLQEYNIALENGTIKENMVCYITDDTLYTDDIRPEIETLNSVKANKDLSNLSEVGEKHFLNKSQITNCITEIPQRVKYTLIDGTLTILKGSVVIVPYGTEDLTAQYPKGATFINDNFRVYDTQFADGKFFVWAELVDDVVQVGASLTDTNERTSCLALNDNGIPTYATGGSGTSYPTSGSGLYFHTTDNKVVLYTSGTVQSNVVLSLPIGKALANGVSAFGSIKQVFNGMGYIGSTIWVDKGVKCLMPNGRNKDGSLNNLEFMTPRIAMRHFPATQYTSFEQMFAIDTELGMGESILVELDYIPDSLLGSYKNWVLHTPTNIVYQWNGTAYTPKDSTLCIIAHHVTIIDGVIKSFQPKQPLRAIDFSNKSEVSGWAMPSNKYIDLVLGATDTTYTAPSNGYFSLGGTFNKNGRLHFFNRTTGSQGISIYYVANSHTAILMPVRKGDIIAIFYDGTYTTSSGSFKFIYAEGEA